MIKNLKHAKQVQQRRFVAGKRGVAKAVRRFLKRHHSDDYQRVLSSMSVRFYAGKSVAA